MGKLIRRDVTPVGARRVPPPVPASPPPVVPQTVFISSPTGQPPPADTRPHVTQNFFNVSVPAGAAQPPPQPAAAPTEVHHHHHTTVNYGARLQPPTRNLSFGGAIGLVLGALACAAAYVPAASGFGRPLAMAGLAAGALGMLSAVLIGRSGRGVPALALLVSLVGYGLAMQSAGKLAPAVQQISKSWPTSLANVHIDTSNGLDISVRNSAPAAAAPAATPKQTISSHTAPPPAAPAPATPKQIAASPDLENARLAAAKRMGLDYAGAKDAADKAANDLRTARELNAPGSPELIAADQASMNANSALATIEQKLRADPAVAAAEKAAER